jgi:hypothetical protein
MRAVLTPYKTPPHNRYQPHPAEPEQHTKCSNRAFVLLKMGIMMLASYKTAPHNRYQPHPAEPEQYTKCSNTVIVLLKMGIMMPETC